MKYQPSAIGQTELDIAEAPYLGGEFAVYLSRQPAFEIGTVTLSASGSGTWARNLATTNADGSMVATPAGGDLQCVAATALSSPGGNCVVTFNVVDENALARKATATFQPPTRVNDQSGNFERGVAVDLVLDGGGGGTKIVKVAGVDSVLHGNTNVVFTLYKLPEAADYVLVGCTTEKKFNIKSRKPVGIDCGMTADAFVKPGKSKPGDLTIDSKFGGMWDRLTRFDGARTTGMLLGLKEGQVTNDRMVFIQYIPGVEVTLPEGEGEAMENAATGKFVDHAFFMAG